MSLRVLLLDSPEQDVSFLSEVLAEIQAAGPGRDWVRVESHQVSSWSDAAAILANEPIDLILLALDFGGSPGPRTGPFLRLQAIAPEVPVILLIAESERALALQLVRGGAQDFLIRDDLDCAPLAHAMSSAIERHRLLTASRAVASLDGLTGLSTRAIFLALADRDRKLAERLGRRLMLVVAHPRNLDGVPGSDGDHHRDLALLTAADQFRYFAGPTDLLGRIGEARFGMTIFDTDAEALEAAWARIHSASLSHHIDIGAAIFDAAHPASLETLLEQAEMDLAPGLLAQKAFAVRR